MSKNIVFFLRRINSDKRDMIWDENYSYSIHYHTRATRLSSSTSSLRRTGSWSRTFSRIMWSAPLPICLLVQSRLSHSKKEQSNRCDIFRFIKNGRAHYMSPHSGLKPEMDPWTQEPQCCPQSSPSWCRPWCDSSTMQWWPPGSRGSGTSPPGHNTQSGPARPPADRLCPTWAVIRGRSCQCGHYWSFSALSCTASKSV